VVAEQENRGMRSTGANPSRHRALRPTG